MGAAFRAKRKIRRAHIATAGARVRLLGAALRAESKAALNLGTATGAVHGIKTPRKAATARSDPGLANGPRILGQDGLASPKRQVVFRASAARQVRRELGSNEARSVGGASASDHTPATCDQISASLRRNACQRVNGTTASSSSGKRRPMTLTRPPPRLRATSTIGSSTSSAPSFGA